MSKRKIIISIEKLLIKIRKPIQINRCAGTMKVKKGKGSYNRKKEKYGWKYGNK